MAATSPGRLKWMASVPLQAPDRAAAVLADWEAAAHHRMPVMLHPAYTVPNPSLGDFYLENVIGFPLETTVAIERLICAGTLDRHPALRVVLLHAGGYFPWQAGRLRHARTVRPELASSPTDPWSYLGQVLLDPITHDADALRYMVGKVGAANIVMGTDLPFDMATPEPMGALLEACDEETAAVIAERNPAELYGLKTAVGTEGGT